MKNSMQHLVLLALLASLLTACDEGITYPFTSYAGPTDEELQPLFKSAEGYLRMWEKSEARGAILRNSSN